MLHVLSCMNAVRHVLVQGAQKTMYMNRDSCMHQNQSSTCMGSYILGQLYPQTLHPQNTVLGLSCLHTSVVEGKVKQWAKLEHENRAAKEGPGIPC